MSVIEPNSSTSTPLESTPSDSETNYDLPQKRVRKGGPVFDEVWDYVVKGEKVNPGHYKAECFHCGKSWQRGKPYVLRSHLALYCQHVPEDIRRYWLNKLAEDNNAHRRDSQLQIALPPQVNINYDKLVLKTWVMANISFEVIENPYIKCLFKNLNPAYVLPSRTTLSERLLDEEVARVQNSINDELECVEYLTLSMHNSN